MLNHRYFVFFIVAIGAVLLWVGYFSVSATQTQDPKEKAFEVAADACGIYRKMGIEQVNNREAVLETWGESTVYKVWVVQLTGTWQSLVTPVPTIETPNTPDLSVPPSEWLIVCEVSISSKDWHVIGTKQTRTKISP